MSSQESYLESVAESYIPQVCFAHHSNLLASIAFDCTLSQYDGTSRELLYSIKTVCPLLSIIFSEDDVVIYGCGVNGGIYCYNQREKESFVVVEPNHTITSHIVLNRTYNVLLTSDISGMMKKWEIQPDYKQNQLAEQNMSLRILTFDSQKDVLVISLCTSMVAIASVSVFANPEIRSSALGGQTTALKVHPEKAQFIQGSVEGKIAVDPIDINDATNRFAFKVKKTMENGETAFFPISALTYHPVYKTFVTAGADGMINIWSGEHKKKVSSAGPYHTAISSVDFNFDGTIMAIALSFGQQTNLNNIPIKRPVDAILLRKVEEKHVKYASRK